MTGSRSPTSSSPTPTSTTSPASAEARERLGNPPFVAHAEAAAELDEEVERRLSDGEKLSTGGLEIEAISTPGHAAGHLAFLVNGSDLFTADVLFKGTVGGTMAPGASGFADLKRLGDAADGAAAGDPRPPGPPRADDDRRGVGGQPLRADLARPRRRPARRRCTVWGRPATLKLWAPDYDGGNKAWIVFGDDGDEAIVGGSQVERG